MPPATASHMAMRIERRTSRTGLALLPSSAATIQGEIDGISAGPVALAVYQDLNNDGELNRSSFGIPVEPYGFSNDARGQMGPPSFTDAQVQAGPNSPVIPISLTKLKF